MYEININCPIHVHFMGIGGISMSGLAEVLLSKNFTVSGSDIKNSPLTEKLESLGAKIYIGQLASNITDDIDLLVYTAAISSDNDEFLAAKEKNIPMLTRAQMWGQVMKGYKTAIAVSGTHGKTTTTSMITELMINGDMDPTVTVGGILPSIGGNLRLGKSDNFITEACEYTNSFLSFYPTIEVILNIEEDHLDFFKDINDIRNSFKQFTKKLPEDGYLVINGAIENIEYFTKDLPCPFVSFGIESDDNYSAKNIRFNEQGFGSYDLYINGSFAYTVSLSVTGTHNILNSLAAVAVSDHLGIAGETIAQSLTAYNGINRRFQYKGSLGGISIYDDYAHHPTEIQMAISAARKVAHERLVVIFQPHTYTRTQAFLKDFAKALSKADLVVLTDIYAAREKNTLGISSEDLQKEILNLGADCKYFSSFDAVENFLLENSIHGDLLITMGAGDVVNIGENLLGQ